MARDETRKLRAEVRALGPRGPGRRFPAPLRARLTGAASRLRDAGTPLAAVGRALGVPAETLRQWLRRGALEGQQSAPAMVPVRVQEIVTAATPSVVVVSPSGWRVEGLDAAQAAVLLRELA